MSNAILYIQDTEIPLLNDISIPVNYSIQDIRYQSDSSADFIKTVELPSTKELDLIFENIFSPSIDLQYFDPNLKTDARLRIGNNDVFTGSIKLVKIFHSLDTGITKYICDFIGKKSDLFYNIGDKYLTGNDDPADDLDFSTYDHIINTTNITDSWSASNYVGGVVTAVSAGVGYRYALIDYGYLGSGNNGGGGYTFKVPHLRPLLFVREFLNKIFTDAGKTWTSTILDSALFKKLVIPPSDVIKLTDATLIDRQLFAGINSSMLVSHSMTLSGSVWNSAVNTDIIEYNDDSTSPLFDTGGHFNTGTHIATIAGNGDYTITANISLYMVVNNTGAVNGPLANVPSRDHYAQVFIQKYIGGVWTTVASSGPINGNGANSFYEPLSAVYEGYAYTGDQFRAVVTTFILNADLKNGIGNTITTGTTTYDVSVSYVSAPSENGFRVKVKNELQEGDDVEVNKCIPLKIKQKDFLKGIINMFNLYLTIDPSNSDNYLIETYGSFFNGTPVDWTSKLDISKPIETLIMGELDYKKYNFKFKDDGDYFNKSYKDNWGETYGTKTYSVTNQFLTNETTTEVVFSPTPMVGTVNSLFTYTIIPHIYNYDNSEISNINSNIRILQWNGLKTGYWDLKSNSGSNLQTEIPFAGTIDDPQTPTFDLNFGVPNEIYVETIPDYVWPSANLSTTYWDSFISNISNKNSRIVIMYMVLDDADIKSFDFRNPVIINGVKYTVNKIENYETMGRESTRVEFLKMES
jgi:hypothetical protein